MLAKGRECRKEKGVRENEERWCRWGGEEGECKKREAEGEGKRGGERSKNKVREDKEKEKWGEYR